MSIYNSRTFCFLYNIAILFSIKFVRSNILRYFLMQYRTDTARNTKTITTWLKANKINSYNILLDVGRIKGALKILSFYVTMKYCRMWMGKITSR
jgi:hypothetical protein